MEENEIEKLLKDIGIENIFSEETCEGSVLFSGRICGVNVYLEVFDDDNVLNGYKDLKNVLCSAGLLDDVLSDLRKFHHTLNPSSDEK